MNFFQSVFSDDPDPSAPNPEPESDPNLPHSLLINPNPNPNIPSITSAWTFGSSLMKTLASKSESVIETYRRDLEEFTSGIKNETAVIREAAVNAVKDLPASFEAGAGLAQESLESVGQAIDDIAGIIAHGKDSVLAGDYSDSNSNSDTDSNRILRNSKPYSRLNEQIRTVKSDMNTYLIDPEDLDEFNEWKLGFKVEENVREIDDDDAINGNDRTVMEIFREIVPERVDEKSFWIRYFYKVYKIKKAEEVRVNLVNRAISGEEDEELSWDVDEDDFEDDVNADLKVEKKESGEVSEKQTEVKDVSGLKNDNETEVDNVKVIKVGDVSSVSTQTSPEEDGWDEIEDIGNGDKSKKKAVFHVSSDRVELRKRLSVANEKAAEEEAEDLTWDIEDDDENGKA